MSVLPWDTYSRLEVTCDAGAVAIRAQVRALNPSRMEYEVLDLDNTTVLPFTKAVAMQQLAAALEWQAAAGAAAADVYSRFELQAMFGDVTIAVASKVNGVIVPSDETQLSVENNGPFLAMARSLLEASHAYVVAAKGL